MTLLKKGWGKLLVWTECVHHRNEVAIILGINGYFTPRRGCLRILKFVMQFKLKENNHWGKPTRQSWVGTYGKQFLFWSIGGWATLSSINTQTKREDPISASGISLCFQAERYCWSISPPPSYRLPSKNLCGKPWILCEELTKVMIWKIQNCQTHCQILNNYEDKYFIQTRKKCLIIYILLLRRNSL